MSELTVSDVDVVNDLEVDDAWMLYELTKSSSNTKIYNDSANQQIIQSTSKGKFYVPFIWYFSGGILIFKEYNKGVVQPYCL